MDMKRHTFNTEKEIIMCKTTREEKRTRKKEKKEKKKEDFPFLTFFQSSNHSTVSSFSIHFSSNVAYIPVYAHERYSSLMRRYCFLICGQVNKE